jgi:hypothetical protein
MIVQSYLWKKEYPMKKLHLPFLHSFLAIALTFAFLVSPVQAAYASNGAFTWQKTTDTFEIFGTCSDPNGLYQITVVSSGTIQYVETQSGYKFSWAENGTYSVEPINADSSVTYSGRYTISLQDHLSNGASIFKHTHTDVGLGSDGTHEVFHITEHLVVTPTGLVREAGNFQWICN